MIITGRKQEAGGRNAPSAGLLASRELPLQIAKKDCSVTVLQCPSAVGKMHPTCTMH